MKKLFIMLSIASILSGCAGFQQAVTGYESSAAAGIRATHDNEIVLWKAAACNTSVSAMIRNPEIVPALKALCLPQGSASPITLLDATPQATKP